jgi:hypothetical protein
MFAIAPQSMMPLSMLMRMMDHVELSKVFAVGVPNFGAVAKDSEICMDIIPQMKHWIPKKVVVWYSIVVIFMVFVF